MTFQPELNKIYNSDCLTFLQGLPDNFIDCCVTSPPYFGLRDYGVDGQIGLEETPDQFVAKLVSVFEEVRRVLKPEGTLWLNLGDSYATKSSSGRQGKTDQRKNRTFTAESLPPKGVGGDIKQKDLIGIPWMVAFALRSAGWYLRQDIIWHKPNPMPESVTDRCTKAHEYIFLMSKSAKYYYDSEAIRVPLKDESIRRLAQDIENQKGSERVPGKTNGTMKAVRKNKGIDNSLAASGAINHDGKSGYFDKDGNLLVRSTANKKSVWTVTTKPFKEAHFATFPKDLIVDCIKAGCPEGGIVLDPFMGAGTTTCVALENFRNFIGCELNPEYIKIAEKRLSQYEHYLI